VITPAVPWLPEALARLASCSWMERALEVFIRNARCLEAGLPPATAVNVAVGY
jgi:hypothetical protein